MKKSSGQFMNVGGASVVVIFVVLCLSMLGALAASSSFADLRLSARYRDSITQYYKADGQVQEKIFLLKENLILNGINEQVVKSTVDGARTSMDKEGLWVGFFERIDDKQSLDVRLLFKNNNGTMEMQVVNYKMVRTQKDTYESNLRLWDGSFE